MSSSSVSPPQFCNNNPTDCEHYSPGTFISEALYPPKRPVCLVQCQQPHRFFPDCRCDGRLSQYIGRFGCKSPDQQHSFRRLCARHQSCRPRPEEVHAPETPSWRTTSSAHRLRRSRVRRRQEDPELLDSRR
jgi:hypothetical protein